MPYQVCTTDTGVRQTGAGCATAKATGVFEVASKGTEGRGGLDCSSRTLVTYD